MPTEPTGHSRNAEVERCIEWMANAEREGTHTEQEQALVAYQEALKAARRPVPIDRMPL